jgi:hypothetical protein
MIWQNPWAWLGVLGVALPIVIHLLGRGHARVMRFPTLRFIDASRLLPTKRSRIQDPLLLAVRVAIPAIGALALAQPLVLTPGRRQALDRGLARAVIVDTSASMRRVSDDSVRVVARRLAADARSSIVIESAHPRAALAGAAAWLGKQQRAGDIAIVSDFQRGELVKADLARVPTTVGIVLRRPPMSSPNDTVRVFTIAAQRTRMGVAEAAEAGVNVQWRASGDSRIDVPVALLAAPGDSLAVAATRTAAATLPVRLPIDSTRAVAIVLSGHGRRDSLIRVLSPATTAWKLSLLSDARASGLSIAAAGDATIDGERQFVILTDARPASLDAARLATLARRATSTAPSAAELEPGVVSDVELQTWERAAVPGPAAARYRSSDENGPSDGRWLWAVALGLLLLEWGMRRRAKDAAATIASERARAA